MPAPTPLAILRRTRQILTPRRWRRGSVGHTDNMCLLGGLYAARHYTDEQMANHPLSNSYFGDLAWDTSIEDSIYEDGPTIASTTIDTLFEAALDCGLINQAYINDRFSCTNVEDLSTPQKRDILVAMNDDHRFEHSDIARVLDHAILRAAGIR